MKALDRAFWTRTLVGAAVISASVGMTVRLAKADPGGHTHAALTFAGTLEGGTRPTETLTFTFRKGSATVCAPTAMVTPDAAGRFTAEIPLDQSGRRCPDNLFDGDDVTFDVSVGTTVVASGQPINPVPYARYADQVGTPDCPVGYERDRMATGMILCRRPLAGGASDEVVRVGSGASAFWIDRYEATVWQNADGSGEHYGSASEDYPSTFPQSGQWSVPLYALSRVGYLPSGNATWFLVSEACAASGKRLPSNAEWTRAARQTPDPDVSDGSGGRCLTMGAGVRSTGMGTLCRSAWGAEDMIGNRSEVTLEWYAGAGASNSASGSTINDPRLNAWSSGYANDGTWNVNGVVVTPSGVAPALPAVALRGGYFRDGANAGVFAFDLTSSPSRRAMGFRCVIPR